MHDVIIVGAGPAGLTAGVYAARNKLNTLVLTESVPTEEALKEPGLAFVVASFKHELASPDKLLELKKQTMVTKVEKNIVSFLVEDKTGKVYYARSVVLATGEDNSEQANSRFEDITEKSVRGHIKVDASMQTSVGGMFAAGQVNDSLGKDTFITSAQGAQAALNAAKYLRNLR